VVVCPAELKSYGWLVDNNFPKTFDSGFYLPTAAVMLPSNSKTVHRERKHFWKQHIYSNSI